MSNRSSIRIGVIMDEPLSNRCAFQRRCQYKGLAYDAALTTCRILRLNCTFHLFDSYDYGHLDETGNMTGLLRAVQDGRYDTSLPFITATYSRFQSVRFSAGIFFVDNVLVTRVPKRKRESEIDWSVVHSFDWSVWSSFITIFLLAVFAMSLVEKMRHREWRSGIRSTIPLDFENRRRRYDRISDRFCYMAFSLLEFMFVCNYAGIMYSNQVTSKETPPFVDLDSFIECLLERKCRLIAPTLSYSSFLLLQAQGGDRLAEALSANDPIIKPMSQIPRAIIDEQNVYLTWLIPRMFYSSLTRNNQNCDFYDVTAPFLDVNTFPLRKNDSHLRKLFDGAAGLLHQQGIVNALEAKYRVNVNLCQNVKDPTPIRMPVLSLKSTLGALVIYACGVLASIGLFGLERITDRVSSNVRSCFRTLKRKISPQEAKMPKANIGGEEADKENAPQLGDDGFVIHF